MRITRSDVRDLVSCPACSAGPGSRCFNGRGQPRTSNHAERINYYRELIG